MVSKNSHLLSKEPENEGCPTDSMRPPLTVILGTLDLMREGIFDGLDQEKKTQLINNAFSSAQKLNVLVEDLSTKNIQPERSNLMRFSISLLKEGARTILPQS